MNSQTKIPSELKAYLKNNTLIGVKGGRERETFLNIWMVQVEDRFFSRSWNKSSKSWFTEFISSGMGQLRLAESVINVQGRQLSATDPLQEQIDQAYLQKYNQPENLFYSQGITQPEYHNYTMEFLIDQNQSE